MITENLPFKFANGSKFQKIFKLIPNSGNMRFPPTRICSFSPQISYKNNDNQKLKAFSVRQ